MRSETGSVTRSYIRRPNDGTALLVVAHPDDEVIFFFGTIARLKARGWSVHVVCVTGTSDTPAETTVRQREFWESCRRLRVSGELLHLLDARGASLCQEGLQERVSSLFSLHRPLIVVTHNPWGEYGHLHHMQVSAAVHSTFGNRVLCPSGPLPPRMMTALNEDAYKSKIEHMRCSYESQAFAASWCSQSENLVRIPSPVAVALAGVLSSNVSTSSWAADVRPEVRKILLALADCINDPSRHARGELITVPSTTWMKRLAPAVRRGLSPSGPSETSLLGAS